MSDRIGPADVVYGPDVSTDAELKLCGSPGGKRILEIGLYGTIPNSVTLAQHGARSIAVDPSPERIARARRSAEDAGVVVEFHTADVVDFGSVMSGTIDLALSVHSLTSTHDYARAFRQAHRVLKPGGSFVLCMRHPVAAMMNADGTAVTEMYGTSTPTIGDVVMTLQRANFSVDVLHELISARNTSSLIPSTLVLRARKIGS